MLMLMLRLVMTSPLVRLSSLLESKEPHSLLRCPHCKEKLRLWLGPGQEPSCSGDCGPAGEKAQAQEDEIIR